MVRALARKARDPGSSLDPGQNFTPSILQLASRWPCSEIVIYMPSIKRGSFADE